MKTTVGYGDFLSRLNLGGRRVDQKDGREVVHFVGVWVSRDPTS